MRRKEASRLFDICLALLKDGDKKGFENLTNMEKQGLKSLQRRVKQGEIIICQCDKSGKFALSREQYIEAGEKHTRNDIEITTEVSMNKERNLNGHMRWWAGMTQLGKSWNQEDRSVGNLLNFGLAVCLNFERSQNL